MKNFTLMSIVAGGLLLAGCGGGSSDSSMQSSTDTGAAPVTPVVSTPVPAPEPVPAVKQEFSDYLTKMVSISEWEEPAATDDLEFTFTNEDDDTVYAALLEAM